MNNQQNKKGFTIIEVVLVLAIAGLIFMMVFIALPSLQRSQRDTQRKNDLNRLETALTSYQSNNRGALPTAFSGNDTTSWTSFVNRYIVTGGDQFVDPSGTPYVLKDGNSNTLPTDFDANNPDVIVTVGSICNGESLTPNQGTRKVAFQMKLEGNGIACANN